MSMPSTRRVAFVVGNGLYTDPSLALDCAPQDADDVAVLLQARGYASVVKLINASNRDMKRSFKDFAKSLTEGCMAVVYFAGHGIEVGGKSFLLGVDSEPWQPVGSTGHVSLPIVP